MSLQSLDDEIQMYNRCKTVTTLNLSHRSVVVLPSTIGNLTGLKALLLCDCDLSMPPSEIAQLENLAELNLDGNKLTMLPSSFGNLTRLKMLTLSRNPVSYTHLTLPTIYSV